MGSPLVHRWMAGLLLALAAGSSVAADWSQSDRDFDLDFEADDVLALNMSAAGRSAARALGFRVQLAEPLRNLRLWMTRLRPPPGLNVRLALERLRLADPEGIYSQNAHYALAGDVARCDPARCWGRAKTGADHPCPLPARIGMVDSAIDTGSPLLKDKAIETRRFSPTRVSGTERRHGTMVASLLLGGDGSEAIGLVPGVRLHAADVFSLDAQNGLSTDAARIASALDWLVGANVSLINMSFDGPASRVLEIVTRQVLERGIVLIAAAGNRGPGAEPAYPAAYPGVIAVTAVDRYLKAFEGANTGAYVALAAPGVAVWTADEAGAGLVAEGTSFAAPFVSAAALRLLASDPALPPAAVRRQLIAGALDLGPKGIDPVYGAGLVQMPRCVAGP